VVCRFRPERRLRALGEASGLPESEVHARIWESGLDAGMDRGEYQLGAAHRAVVHALALRLDLDAVAAFWALAFEPDPAILRLVDRIRPRWRTGLLTDNGPLLRAALPTRLPEVVRRFDWLLFSCEVGAVKPSLALFERVVTRTGCPADGLLLVDDCRRNVEGARVAGLAAILYTGPGALARALRRLAGGAG